MRHGTPMVVCSPVRTRMVPSPCGVSTVMLSMEGVLNLMACRLSVARYSKYCGGGMNGKTTHYIIIANDDVTS